MKSNFNKKCITPSQMNLISNVRVFFRRFTNWIRAYIISRYTGVGTPEELFDSLYLESNDFGRIFHVFWGRQNSNRFTELLNQFTIGLRELISDQLAGSGEAAKETVNRLYKNMDDIASFLASLSPDFNEDEWKGMLRTYLQHTLEEANLFISGDYTEEIETFDRLDALSDKMGYLFAQALSDYITADSQDGSKYPPKGKPPCLTLAQVNTIDDARTIWFDLATWVRNFMLSKYKGIGDENVVHARLQQIPAEFVNTLKKIFGNKPVFDAYQRELTAYADLIDSLTTAEMKGNTDEVNRITRLLYQNADQRAALFASLNPKYWNKDELQARLYDNLKSTLEESTTFLTGDYAKNLNIYNTLLNQAESISGEIAQGLMGYILTT